MNYSLNLDENNNVLGFVLTKNEVEYYVPLEGKNKDFRAIMEDYEALEEKPFEFDFTPYQ